MDHTLHLESNSSDFLSQIFPSMNMDKLEEELNGYERSFSPYSENNIRENTENIIPDVLNQGSFFEPHDNLSFQAFEDAEKSPRKANLEELIQGDNSDLWVSDFENNLEVIHKNKLSLDDSNEIHEENLLRLNSEVKTDLLSSFQNSIQGQNDLGNSERKNSGLLQKTFTQVRTLLQTNKDKTKSCLKSKDRNMEESIGNIVNDPIINSGMHNSSDGSESSDESDDSNNSSNLVRVKNPKKEKQGLHVDYGKSVQNVLLLLYAWHEFRKNFHMIKNGKMKKFTAKLAAEELQFPSKSLDYYKLTLTKYCSFKEKPFDISEYLTKSFGEFYSKIELILDPEQKKAKLKELKKEKSRKEAKLKELKKDKTEKAKLKELKKDKTEKAMLKELKKHITQKISKKGTKRPSAHGENKLETKRAYFNLLLEYNS